ncbi:hypothetical protein HanIR_Chr04g0207881 [Helianthus annuus]|nr:hypothetical protein HanIR_Chr04g0207881 [Helianthus annuus]
MLASSDRTHFIALMCFRFKLSFVMSQNSFCNINVKLLFRMVVVVYSFKYYFG